MFFSKTFKVVAVPVILRQGSCGIEIHTQTRHVINKDYDPLYDNTYETCGETLEPGESVISAALRGCAEEMGVPDFQPQKLIGADAKNYNTRDEDEILGFEPYYYVQQMRGPQPWVGLVFIVVVDSDFEPRLDKEGEVSAHQWWAPAELYTLLRNSPEKFMGFHYPALLKICSDILEGKLKA